MTEPPVIWWIRRDLRLDDNPLLSALVAARRPVIPLFILDPETEALGAASKWRLGLGLAAFAQTLAQMGSRLNLRRGNALEVLQALLAETGATGVHWGRLYDPTAVTRDTAVKGALKASGAAAVSHPGHLLHEPWTVATGAGGFYRVFTPYWNAVRGRDVPSPEPAPNVLRPPGLWPASDRLEDWRLGAAMRRGGAIVARRARVGEAAARARLDLFMAGPIGTYEANRDLPWCDGTSRLSENLTWGEIGVRRLWQAGMLAREAGARGAETYLKELTWREFSYHLLHHTPTIVRDNWKPEWDSFPWRGGSAWSEAWQRGRTGVPFVDAAMREMYVTGTMHNRARMIAGSYLTKHLLTDWRVGLAWFADCLTDWDPAANAMGWQWVAGSGPDAAPYFRVFNPVTQADKFDAGGLYRRRFIAELSHAPGQDALDYFAACPESWELSPQDPYPSPIVALAEGRRMALEVYSGHRANRGLIGATDARPAQDSERTKGVE